MYFYIDFLTDNWWRFLLTAVTAYLLGSINTAVLVTKIVTKGKQDIRQMGSGNAGFTNVMRCVGKVPAIVTFVCDMLKCVAAVIIGAFIFSFVTSDNQILANEFVNCGKYIAGIFCILGHSYPVYFRFKGGKGVVTAATLIALEDWRVFLCVIAAFLIVFVITKIISISSITAAVLYAPLTFIMTFFIDYKAGYSAAYVALSTIAALVIAVFVIAKHKENIGRLIRGEEKKITSKK